jgi:hypothetical protein
VTGKVRARKNCGIHFQKSPARRIRTRDEERLMSVMAMFHQLAFDRPSNIFRGCCKCFTTSEGGENDPFAKPLYGLTPVPRVRIPPSPPRSLDRRESRPFFLRNTQKMPVFRDYSQTNRTAENGPHSTECSQRPGFLRKAHAQSGFRYGIRRMQCDQKPWMRPWRVDFCRHLGNRFRRFP